MAKDQDVADDTRKQYFELRQDTVHKEYLRLLQKDMTKAFVMTPTKNRRMRCSSNHPDHAEAYVNRMRVKDRNTREELQPD